MCRIFFISSGVVMCLTFPPHTQTRTHTLTHPTLIICSFVPSGRSVKYQTDADIWPRRVDICSPSVRRLLSAGDDLSPRKLNLRRCQKKKKEDGIRVTQRLWRLDKIPTFRTNLALDANFFLSFLCGCHAALGFPDRVTAETHNPLNWQSLGCFSAGVPNRSSVWIFLRETEVCLAGETRLPDSLECRTWISPPPQPCTHPGRLAGG